MKLKIICVGNIKDNNLNNLVNKYINKIKQFINIEVISLKEEKISDETNTTLINQALKKEADKIKEKLELNSYTFINSIKGINWDSLEFAKNISYKINNSSLKSINFIIGSSHGLHESIYSINNSQEISFSNLTFPHQLFQLILLEQIYRSFTIINNHKYHK